MGNSESVRWGGNEEEWAENVLALEAPTSRYDLRAMLKVLGGEHLAFMDIGRDGNKSGYERSKLKAAILRAKLNHLHSGVSSDPFKKFPEAERLVTILTRLDDAFARFLSGDVFVSIASDVGNLRSTLDNKDVRSLHRSVGLSDRIGQTLEPRIHGNEVVEYEKRSRLGADCIEFLLHGVLVADLERFVKKFTPEELYKFRDVISSSGTAASVATRPLDDEYLTFLAGTVRQGFMDTNSRFLKKEECAKLYPERNWSERQHILSVAYDNIKGNSQEKLEFLSWCRAQHITYKNFVSLLRIPNFGRESFEADCTTYDGKLAPEEIINLRIDNLDLEETVAALKRLPEVMRTPDFIIARHTFLKDRDQSRIDEFISLYDPGVENDTYSIEMLLWFLDNYDDAKRNIEFARSHGILSIGMTYEMSMDKRVPLEYRIAILDTLRILEPSSETGGPEDSNTIDQTHRTLNEWYKAGITGEELSECRGLWDVSKGVPWSSVEVANIRAYVELKKDPIKSALLQELCEKFDLVPAEIAAMVNEGYSREIFETIQRLFGMTIFPWFPFLRDHPQAGAVFEVLSDDDKVKFMKRDALDTVAQHIKKGMSVEAAFKEALAPLTLKENSRRVRFVDPNSTEKSLKEESSALHRRKPRDAYAKYLDNISEDHNKYIELFKFFKISPEDMDEHMSYSATKWELTDTLVNHIVLLTHSQDKMPQRLRPLIEKYHMSFFTRYPAEILDAMVQNYEGEKEKKRIAIILVAKSDYNSALNTITQVERSIFRQHKTYIYEVGSKADFYSATRELGEECAGRGEKIGLVQFDGHGDEKVIQFGFPYTYSKTELSSSSVGFLTPLRRYLSDNAQLVLSACETAKGKEGLNIAYNFANAWKGVEVFASNAETGTRDILFDREGRVTDVKYTKGDSLVVYKL